MEIDEEKSCTSFKSRTFKEKQVTFTDHCTIPDDLKTNVIFKQNPSRKCSCTQDEQETFRENMTIIKRFQI